MTDLARVKEVFVLAADVPADEVDRFLAERCGDDDVLREKVMRLLAADRCNINATDLPASSSAADCADLAQVASFRDIRLLGSGGFGSVYAARQVAPVHREVAIKVLRRGLDFRETTARFEREQRVLARLTHHGIATIFDVGKLSDGRPWFSMEIIDARPITEYCDVRALSLRGRIKLMIDVCRAVQHAHSKGILHRDLKPSNILVRDVEGQAQPKIIDFGIAKLVRRESVAQTLFTTVGTILGTPEYMSPEQADLRESAIDTRSDVYALGVLLYELLTGQRPFDFDSQQPNGMLDFLAAIRECDAPSLAARVVRDDATVVAARRCTDIKSLVSALRGELDWIVHKALEKDAERRYASADDLALDLERYLRGDAVAAGPKTILYALTKFVQGHVVATVVAVAVLLALVAGSFVALRQRSFARAHEERTLSALASMQQAVTEEQAALAAYERLRDLPLARRLVQAAQGEELWPAVPRMVEAMDAWLEEARALSGRHARREALAAVDAEDSYVKVLLRELDAAVQQLDRQAVPSQAMGHGGWVADVAARRVRAASLAERSIVAERRAWEAVRARIAEEPRYRGLQGLRPQLGLVPLGKDVHSHLEEFALLDSGDRPRRDAAGRLGLDGGTAVVFVLMPPGRFAMGAQADDPLEPNYDPHAIGREGPVHDVEVAAFFIGKTEMTQGQWLRLAGENPSVSRSEISTNGETGTLAHPVQNVSRPTCLRVLARAGCTLPTEEEWEYAARAGTTTPWWTGRDSKSLEGAANLRWGGADGFVSMAPVAQFRANAFGLHDVAGNVWEWCRDTFGPYGRASAPDASAGIYGVYRGGGRGMGPSFARSARRWHAVPEIRNRSLGLRPARSID